MGTLQSELLKIKIKQEKEERHKQIEKSKQKLQPLEKRHLHSSQQEDLELYIGIDFGTSFIKVCVRDLTTDESVAIKLFQHKDGLTPTTILYDKNTDILRLLHNTELPKPKDSQIILPYLKLLVADMERIDGRGLKQKDIEAITVWLLSTVIAETKLHFKIQESERCKGKHLVWTGVNMGVPVDFFNSEIESKFKHLLNCALFIANDREITKKPELSFYREYLNSLKDVKENYSLNGDEDVSVYPEIAAAVNSFIFRRDMREGYYAYFDIGGGTLDGIVFANQSIDGEQKIDVITGKIEPLGVDKVCHSLITETIHPDVYADNINSMKKKLMKEDLPHEVQLTVRPHASRAAHDIHSFVAQVVMPLKKRDQLMQLQKQESISLYIGGGGYYSMWYHHTILGVYSSHQHQSCNMPTYIEKQSYTVEALYPKDNSIDHKRFLIAYGLSIPPGEAVTLTGLPSNHPDEDLKTNINPRDYDGIAREKYGEIL